MLCCLTPSCPFCPGPLCPPSPSSTAGKKSPEKAPHWCWVGVTMADSHPLWCPGTGWLDQPSAHLGTALACREGNETTQLVSWVPAASPGDAWSVYRKLVGRTACGEPKSGVEGWVWGGGGRVAVAGLWVWGNQGKMKEQWQGCLKPTPGLGRGCCSAELLTGLAWGSCCQCHISCQLIVLVAGKGVRGAR